MRPDPSRNLIYVGSLGRGAVAERRAALFEDAGWTVRRLDTDQAFKASGPVERRLALQLGAGPIVERIGRTLAAAAADAPSGSVVFFDKPVNIRPAALAALVRRGLRTVSYMPDDPFGPRRDGLWSLFVQCIPAFDLHIVPRKVSVDEFRRQGAREVAQLSFSFDPRLHHPSCRRSPAFPLGYSYIGSPHEQRPRFLSALHQRLRQESIPLSVFGPNWNHWRHRRHGRELDAGPALWAEDYRDAIWDSRACLTFLTRLNRDELSHKAIEVAACGRPPVLEPSPHHRRLFEDGVSAIFFEGVEACARKLIHYWSRPEELDRMGLAAARRVREDDHSEARIVRLVEEAFAPVQAREA